MLAIVLPAVATTTASRTTVASRRRTDRGRLTIRLFCGGATFFFDQAGLLCV
jgi:hypothetical protein